jgi:hypothetical protein
MSDIIALAHSVIEIANDIKHAELQKRVSELTLAAAQVESEKADLIRENTELKSKLHALQENKEHPPYIQ